MSGLCDVPLRVKLYHIAFFTSECACNSDTQNLRRLPTSSDVEHGTNRHFDDHLRSSRQRTDDLGGGGSRDVAILVIQPSEAAASRRKFCRIPSA